MPADHFDFGCDLGPTRGTEPAGAEPAHGICYFCRPSTPRRAHELAMAALDLFAARHPEVDDPHLRRAARQAAFRAIDHGLLNPGSSDELYSRCVAGLVLSATNVSLVPHEMLASGCIPVVNDAEHTRIVLDNDHVAYAPPTPFELADALVALVEARARAARGRRERRRQRRPATTWADAARQFERILRRVVAPAAPRSSRREPLRQRHRPVLPLRGRCSRAA